MSILAILNRSQNSSILKIAPALFLLMIVGIGKFYYHRSIGLLVSSPNFLVFSLYGVSALHFSTARSTQERAALAGIALCLTLLAYVEIRASSHFRPANEMPLSVLASFALAASSTFIYFFLIVTRRRTFAEVVDSMAIPWTFVFAAAVSPLFLNMSELLYPTYDHYLFKFEAGLGVRVEGAIASLVTLANPLAGSTLNLIYNALWLAVILHFAFVPFERPAMPVLAVVCGVAGYSLFLIYPVVGPDFIFGAQNQGVWTSLSADHILTPTNEQLVAVPRNCMPSLHCAWAYLLFWNSRSCRPIVRWGVYIFVILTIVSAIEIGRHWFIDIIVAIPLATAVQALCDTRLSIRDLHRFVPLMSGSLLVALWFFALQSEWFVGESPGILRWIAIIATIIFPIYGLAKLDDKIQEEFRKTPAVGRDVQQASLSLSSIEAAPR